MALEVPRTFFTNDRTFYDREPQKRSWRLPPDRVSDLKDVARGVEETNVGVGCRYLIDHLSGIGHSDIDHDGYVNHLSAAERFCDVFEIWNEKPLVDWRNRIQRCRRALSWMYGRNQTRFVAILHIVYGYPDPFTRTFTKKVLDELGDLASLAKYTDVVEVRRQELARQEAIRRTTQESIIIPTKDLPNHWRGANDQIDEFDSRALSGDEESRIAVAHGHRAEYGSVLKDAIRHREMFEYALKSISSTNALTFYLAPVPDRFRGESEEHYRERLDNADLKRTVFVSQMKIEGSRMLKEASQAYHQAWLKNP